MVDKIENTNESDSKISKIAQSKGNKKMSNIVFYLDINWYRFRDANELQINYFKFIDDLINNSEIHYDVRYDDFERIKEMLELDKRMRNIDVLRFLAKKMADQRYRSAFKIENKVAVRLYCYITVKINEYSETSEGVSGLYYYVDNIQI